MATFSKSFVANAGNSVFNDSEWRPTGDAYTLEECSSILGFDYDDLNGKEAEIVVVTFDDGSSTKRIQLEFKNGTSLQLKAGRNIQKNFDEGDTVKHSLIYGQELKKVGQPSVVRYDVWESEDAKEEYLEKRG